MEILEKATENNTDIILVTDDKKEDWWQKSKGKTIGPHPDLIREFKDKTNHEFYMYQSDRFLELSRETLGKTVSDEIVQETREVRRQDKIAKEELQNSEAKEAKAHLHFIKKQLNAIHEQRDLQRGKLHKLEGMRNEMTHKEEFFITHGNQDPSKNPFLRKYSDISERCNKARMELDEIETECERVTSVYNTTKEAFQDKKLSMSSNKFEV